MMSMKPIATTMFVSDVSDVSVVVKNVQNVPSRFYEGFLDNQILVSLGKWNTDKFEKRRSGLNRAVSVLRYEIESTVRKWVT